MEDNVAVDTMAWMRFVKDDVQGRIVRTVRYLQTLVYVLVHDDGYVRDEYKDCRNGDGVIVALI